MLDIQKVAEQYEDKELHCYDGVYGSTAIIEAVKYGYKQSQSQFTKETVIEILELRNQKAFSLQKFEHEQLSKAIIAIKNLVPPDCFFL